HEAEPRRGVNPLRPPSPCAAGPSSPRTPVPSSPRTRGSRDLPPASPSTRASLQTVLPDGRMVEVPYARHPRARRIKLSVDDRERKSTRLNSSHVKISYAVFCLKKKRKTT